MRRRSSAQLLLRTLLCLSAFVSFSLAVAGTAGAVTISSWVGGKASVPQVVTAADGNCPGTVVMITGAGFVNDGGVVSVSIGGVPSPQIVVGSDIYLYAVVGKGAQTGPVVVTTKGGTATAPGGNAIVFPCQATATASAAPAIVSVTPGKARAGKKIKLAGANFVGASSVTVGGTKAAYAIPSDGILYVIVPAGAKPGPNEIDVTNNKGTTKSTVTVRG